MSQTAALLEIPGVAALFALLNREGEEGRIVGGAVRDALMGRMPHEVDFATTALPEEVIRRASAAGLKSVPTGIAHGTVTVLAEGQPFEVTTLRRDVDTDGRHAVVAFGHDWAEDAQRRDFTINGLFLDSTGRVHDHVGGEADIAARRVRFIGDARTRIREDYLRILRFFRFHSGYADGAPDGDAVQGAICERHGLAHLSRERVRAEVMKLLVTRRAVETLGILADAGLLALLLGGVPRVARLARLVAIPQSSGQIPDAVLRLAAVGLFVADDVPRLQDRFRLSRAEADRLAALAAHQPVLHPGLTEHERRMALYRLGADLFRDRAALAWAASGAAADDPTWMALHTVPERWSPPTLPLRAADFLTAGVPAGPALGAALREAERLWIAADFPADAASLAAIRTQARGRASV